MTNSKKLANSFSTGGGGFHFEAHVQACFVTLMLSGGYAPCLPCWPIIEISLQGKIDGFDTDDLVVIVEDSSSKEQRKLLGQIKHSIKITKNNKQFKEVIQAAWNDFKNPDFKKNKDVIALITGPISDTNHHNVQFLLSQARHTKNVDEFLRHVKQANFSPARSKNKLEAIQSCLEIANNNINVSDNDLYDFLRHFHLLGYDLGKEMGVILSLLHSHISQFQQQNPQMIFSGIVDIVQTWNQDAGTITPNNLPDDILDTFKQKTIVKIPDNLSIIQETKWEQHPDSSYLALVNLIGAWDENNKEDIKHRFSQAL
ncbi:MAG: hypothetical protein GY782_12620 [Gammaproteobacteria bacterium]|nr:hypothetical protein [Gammaproteobacteria bacterium]